MKKILKVVGVLFLIIVLAMAGMVFYLTRGLESGKNLAVQKVDVASLSDGSYQGVYQGGRWSNEVEVTIQNKKITKIAIVKDVTFHNPTVTEELTNKVIEKQNVDVDIVSGATVTCKAYLKSIENALSKK